jgi:hypothetical protein
LEVFFIQKYESPVITFLALAIEKIIKNIMAKSNNSGKYTLGLQLLHQSTCKVLLPHLKVLDLQMHYKSKPQINMVF